MNPRNLVTRRASPAYAAPWALSLALHASALLVCTTLHWGSTGVGARGEGDGDAFTLRLGRSTVLAAAAAAEVDEPASFDVVAPAPATPTPMETAEHAEPPELLAAPRADAAVPEALPLAAESAPAEPRADELPQPSVERELAAHSAPDETLPGVGAAAPKPEVAVGTSGELVFTAAATGTATPSAPSDEKARAPAPSTPAASSGPATTSSAAPGAGASGDIATLPGSGGGDRGPKLIASPRPVYPHEAELRGEYGKVFCLLFVDARGNVEKVEVLRSSGYTRLDRAATSGLARWRFEPAIENGRAVASQFRHTVSFVFE